MIAKDNIQIINKKGLHARASSALAKLANRFDADTMVKKDKMTASAKSILDLMMLGAAKGDCISLTAEGRDEKEAIASLSDFIETGFGEVD